MSSLYAEGIGSAAADPTARVRLMAGYLPELCPTDSEVRMALDFPNDSPLMHDWLGTDGGNIVRQQLAEDDEHYNDPNWRKVHVVTADGEVTNQYEYRATPSGTVSRAIFSTLGWLVAERLQPRGFMAGRRITDN